MKRFVLPALLVLATNCISLIALSHVKRSDQGDTSKTTLFKSDSILSLKLEGDVRTLLNDRGDDAVRHPLHLSYSGDDGKPVNLSVQAKTRGNFRRKVGDCNYPPIMLYFGADDSTNHSIFAGQQKLKLVLPCRNDEFVVKEWQVYKIYNLVSNNSFRTRLVRITWYDSFRKKSSDPVYGIILEDEDELAQRNNLYSVEKLHVPPTQTDSTSFFRMAIFQLLVGNTDWSVQYMQNIKLLVTDTLQIRRPVVVPYDFDMSGWVNAPYAKPAEELLLNSVRTRRFRGYCVQEVNLYDQTISEFRDLKKDIYQIVSYGNLLSSKTIQSEIAFLDEFYKLIDDKEKLKRVLLYPCDKNGTGNVVIKGLQNE